MANETSMIYSNLDGPTLYFSMPKTNCPDPTNRIYKKKIGVTDVEVVSGTILKIIYLVK